MANSFADLDRLGRQSVAGKIVLFNVLFDKQKAARGYAGEAYDEAVVYRGLGARRAAGWERWLRWSGQWAALTIACRIPEEAGRPTFRREP